MGTTILRPQPTKHIRTKFNLAFVVAALLFLLAGLSPRVEAQQINGTFTGTVKDQQGALVIAATVRAINLDTGFTQSAETNADGVYRIQNLPVGRYKVEVIASNFKKFVQENLVLAVDQTEALNITLAIGAQSESVTVTEAPPIVNISNAELGRIVQPEEIIGLPLVNRDANAQISLTAGVQSNTASTSATNPNFQFGLPSTQVIINGGIDSGVPMVSFYLDGAINMTGMRNYGNPLPNPDALQEFQVKTGNFSAEYGRFSGAVVTAVTKSGTNRFHGSLFEFNRNTDLNAAPWNSLFNAPYHRNQFGGVAGGPIRHDKAFFFFSYGGLRQTIGQQLTNGVMPTTLERAGNFSQSKVIPIDPSTGKAYSYNGVAGWIPPSALDKTAAAIINKYIPLPNTANNAYSGYFTGPLSNTEYLGKFDEPIGDRDHLAVSYFRLKNQQDAFGGGNIPYNFTRSTAVQQNASISEIHTLGTATANEAWVTFTRVDGSRINMPEIGMDDLGSTFTTQGLKTLPQLSVSGYFGAGGALAGPVTVTDFYSVRDTVTTTKGKHALDVGMEASSDRDMAIATLANFGVFQFTGVTKNALADFLTGKVYSMEQDTPYTSRTGAWYTALFVQDNYRLLRNLTVNIGLRYDISTPPIESRDRIQTFVPGVQSTVVPTAPLGLLYPGDKGVPRGIVDTRLHHVSPRLGLVWDPFGDGTTAIRAGAGLFFGSISNNEWNQPAAAQPFAVRQTFTSIASFTNVYGNPASFPNGDPFPYTFNPKSPRFLPAASVVAISQNYQWPLIYQFNAAVERQLPSRVVVTGAYVGTLSHNLPFSTDYNNPVWAPGATTAQTSVNARRPYDPGVLGQIWYVESNQTASYHSLQMTVRKPLAKRLLLNGYYVYSKSFISANPQGIALSTAQDFGALWEERGPANNDYRQMVSASGIWHVDYFKGANSVLRQVLNGWSLSPIVTLRSGAPLDMAQGSDINCNTYGSDRPDLVPGVNAFFNPHRPRSVVANGWFNAAAFKLNAVGLGTGPGGTDGNTPRNYLRSPGYRDVDLGMFRDISFERGIKLQVRAEATNAFNMVSLNAPTANLASSLDAKITSAATPRLIQLGMRLTF